MGGEEILYGIWRPDSPSSVRYTFILFPISSLTKKGPDTPWILFRISERSIVIWLRVPLLFLLKFEKRIDNIEREKYTME